MFSLGHPEEGNPPPQYGAGNYFGNSDMLYILFADAYNSNPEP